MFTLFNFIFYIFIFLCPENKLISHRKITVKYLAKYLIFNSWIQKVNYLEQNLYFRNTNHKSIQRVVVFSNVGSRKYSYVCPNVGSESIKNNQVKYRYLKKLLKHSNKVAPLIPGRRSAAPQVVNCRQHANTLKYIGTQSAHWSTWLFS